MKKLLCGILLAGILLPAWGTPFAITDPIPNAIPGASCTWLMDAVPGVTVPTVVATAPLVGLVCQPLDLQTLAVGAHSLVVFATNPPDPLWGGGGPGPKASPLA